MRGLILLLFFALAGCHNPFATHYTGVMDARKIPYYVPTEGRAQVKKVDDIMVARQQLLSEGYQQVGQVSYSGRKVKDGKVIAQAQKVRAQFVLMANPYVYHARSLKIFDVAKTTTEIEHDWVPVPANRHNKKESEIEYMYVPVEKTVVTGYRTEEVNSVRDYYDYHAIFFVMTQSPLGMVVMPPDFQKQKDIQQVVNRESGVMVEAVVTKGPAAAAGINQGDILLEINGVEIKSPAHFEQLQAGITGTSVVVTVWKNGQRTEKKLVLRK